MPNKLKPVGYTTMLKALKEAEKLSVKNASYIRACLEYEFPLTKKSTQMTGCVTYDNAPVTDKKIASIIGNTPASIQKAFNVNLTFVTLANIVSGNKIGESDNDEMDVGDNEDLTPLAKNNVDFDIYLNKNEGHKYYQFLYDILYTNRVPRKHFDRMIVKSLIRTVMGTNTKVSTQSSEIWSDLNEKAKFKQITAGIKELVDENSPKKPHIYILARTYETRKKIDLYLNKNSASIETKAHDGDAICIDGLFGDNPIIHESPNNKEAYKELYSKSEAILPDFFTSLRSKPNKSNDLLDKLTNLSDKEVIDMEFTRKIFNIAISFNDIR